ncbi:MAG TPA: ankyrin repeat domain-containing protein, partial [Pirellulaceae bacterium]|nr:ankyrin repeat domain-containing protein [Pirellulaceae bacterium]
MLHRRRYRLATAACALLLLVAGLTWGGSHVATNNLHEAVAQGDNSRVRWFLRMGADVNVPNRFQYTPLHVAARQGREFAALLLIESGAKIDALDYQLQTPLHCAVTKQDGVIVRAL